MIIQTPYLDTKNDYIQISLKETEDDFKNECFKLSDEGETMAYIYESNTQTPSYKIQKIKNILNQKYKIKYIEYYPTSQTNPLLSIGPKKIGNIYLEIKKQNLDENLNKFPKALQEIYELFT